MVVAINVFLDLRFTCRVLVGGFYGGHFQTWWYNKKAYKKAAFFDGNDVCYYFLWPTIDQYSYKKLHLTNCHVKCDRLPK